MALELLSGSGLDKERSRHSLSRPQPPKAGSLKKKPSTTLLQPNKRKNSAASVAALLVAGSALTTVSAAPQPGSDEDIQSREADYAHFAEM